MGGSFDNFILNFRGKVIKIGAIPRNPHQQARISERVLFCLAQLRGVEDIDLELRPALLEVSTD
jgi:hypothetical protein